MKSWLQAVLSAVIVVAAVSILSSGQHGQTSRPGDLFWAPGIQASGVENYESLREMTENADAVVVGRITDAAPGRSFLADPALGDDGYAYYIAATVQVDSVILQGDEHVAAQLTLEFFASSRTLMERRLASVPDERAMLFLRSKSLEAERLGFSTEVILGERGYWRLVTSEAALRDINGRVELVPGTENGFLLDLAGQSFEGTIGLVRQLTSP